MAEIQGETEIWGRWVLVSESPSPSPPVKTLWYALAWRKRSAVLAACCVTDQSGHSFVCTHSAVSCQALSIFLSRLSLSLSLHSILPPVSVYASSLAPVFALLLHLSQPLPQPHPSPCPNPSPNPSPCPCVASACRRRPLVTALVSVRDAELAVLHCCALHTAWYLSNHVSRSRLRV